jgi:hypothetical protein|tara:strand:- start:3858 stop:3974 length:117 start_codon:yes stop_codon:yes gene_type:complete
MYVGALKFDRILDALRSFSQTPRDAERVETLLEKVDKA